MKFILTLSNWTKDWENVKSLSQLAEQLGFWGLAMPDHYLWTPGRDNTLESWIEVTYLLAMTKSIHIGTLVTPVALRPPAILSKMVSTADFLSNGRVFLGVGAGWSQREFETYSEWHEPKIRVSKAEEAVKLIKAMWTESEINFDGAFYSVQKGILEPKPTQKPYPPLFFGGFGPRMLRLAGKYADIAFIPPWRYENYKDGKEIVLKSAKKYNRSNVSFATASPADKERHFAPVDYDKEIYFKSVEEGSANSCDYFILSLPENKMQETLKNFASDILPSFR